MLCSFFSSCSLLFSFIEACKKSSHQRTGNGVPYAGNSADDCRFRRGCKLCGCGGKVVSQARILHTDLDRNRTFLFSVHTGQFSGTIAQQITKTIMEQDSNKDNSTGGKELRPL